MDPFSALLWRFRRQMPFRNLDLRADSRAFCSITISGATGVTPIGVTVLVEMLCLGHPPYH